MGSKGKRALITGGTSGIGLETAHQFLNEGARVAVTGKNPATLEVARKELGNGVPVIQSDAGDAAAHTGVAERHSSNGRHGCRTGERSTPSEPATRRQPGMIRLACNVSGLVEMEVEKRHV
jgi:NAD(P)-dependent dehydrogenase (short-subunit alcohol dehydrogenase family)